MKQSSITQGNKLDDPPIRNVMCQRSQVAKESNNIQGVNQEILAFEFKVIKTNTEFIEGWCFKIMIW